MAAGAALIASSVIAYLIHYVIFRDAYHIFIYAVGDLAFLPIEVLIVTLIIEKLLSIRETRERLEKLNMVIGVFFSEAGTPLLGAFSGYDRNIDRIRNDLMLSAQETEMQFAAVAERIVKYEYDIDASRINFEALKAFLMPKRELIVRLLENPTLLEHESFTDLLLAVSHLAEELAHRDSFAGLPPADIAHLKLDIRRAYTAVLKEWIAYMKHMKENYPYLFSLAIRLNPFDRNASAIVKE